MAIDAMPNGERRAALLVIHGIGEQSPYETLDAFVRGLRSQLALRTVGLRHWLSWRDGRTEPAVRLELEKPVGRSGVEAIDIFEFWWAGMVQGRIGIRGVLRWIARTSLTPLARWAYQPGALFGERGAIRKRATIIVRELGRAGLLVAVAGALILPFIYAAYHSGEIAVALDGLWIIVKSVKRPVILVIWLVLALFAFFILRGWYQLARRLILYKTKLKNQAIMEQSALGFWFVASLVAVVVLGLTLSILNSSLSLAVPGLLSSIWGAIRPLPVLLPLAAATLAVLLRYPLIRFVGDIALYVTADEKSSFFRTRAEILKESTRVLRTLLSSDAGYNAVYIAGHSLGSVIAYDTINHIIREVRSAPATSSAQGKLTEEDFDRLKGLLTFGSPLDKVYYFFRIQVGDEQTVRAQLLSSLHGFRKRKSYREYGVQKLADYEMPKLSDFRWVNVYSTLDRVSGYLDFYCVDHQPNRTYWNPITAHTAYWNDPGFYMEVVNWL